MTEQEFKAEQQRALMRMLEMSRKSVPPQTPHSMPPAPDFVRVGSQGKSSHPAPPEKEVTAPAAGKQREAAAKGNVNGIEDLLASLGISGGGSDTSLILILLLLLWNDSSDKLLLLALAYILI